MKQGANLLANICAESFPSFFFGLFPTQLNPFKCNCLSPASTRPFRVWPLVSHPTVSTRAQLLGPTSTGRSFRARSLVSGPTVSVRAQPLVSHLTVSIQAPPLVPYRNRVLSSAIACLSPPPCRFEPDRVHSSKQTFSSQYPISPFPCYRTICSSRVYPFLALPAIFFCFSFPPRNARFCHSLDFLFVTLTLTYHMVASVLRRHI